MYVWAAMQVSDSAYLMSISRVTQPGNRRNPSTFWVTRMNHGGFTPLSPAGGNLDRGSPNFAWVSSDGCYMHYTRDYSEFMRVPVLTVFR